MCTRVTGPRSETAAATGAPVRLSEGARRIVWSKMKMRDAPVLLVGRD